MSLLPSARVGLGLSRGCLRSQQPSTLLCNARFALPRQPSPALRSFHTPAAGPGATSSAFASRAATLSASTKAGAAFSSSNPIGAFVAGFGIAALTDLYNREPLSCESSQSPRLDTTPLASSEPEPESIVNVYQLSFGAICGVCAGVFIKKGLKFIAFLLGGGFVLLQYLNSQRLISVNWGKISKRYDGIVDGAVGPRDPAAKGWNNSTAARIWTRFTDFLTANFQERATFLAGLTLGLRLG